MDFLTFSSSGVYFEVDEIINGEGHSATSRELEWSL